jgi:hypothetical protein
LTFDTHGAFGLRHAGLFKYRHPPRHGGIACAAQYSKFLAAVKLGLATSNGGGGGGHRWPTSARNYRMTADASCAKPGQGWAPVISNCSLLAAGADLFMNIHGNIQLSLVPRMA